MFWKLLMKHKKIIWKHDCQQEWPPCCGCWGQSSAHVLNTLNLVRRQDGEFLKSMFAHQRLPVLPLKLVFSLWKEQGGITVISRTAANRTRVRIKIALTSTISVSIFLHKTWHFLWKCIKENVSYFLEIEENSWKRRALRNSICQWTRYARFAKQSSQLIVEGTESSKGELVCPPALWYNQVWGFWFSSLCYVGLSLDFNTSKSVWKPKTKSSSKLLVLIIFLTCLQDYFLLEEPGSANLLSAEQAECLKTVEHHSPKERVDYTAPKNTKQK